MTFGIGLSGMKAAKQDLEVVSNNIANSNTVGFKSSRAEFADVYASSLDGSNARVVAGAGVKVAAITQSFEQGNFSYTNGIMDLAISGNGFFVVNDNGSYLYSRAGYFDLDRDNNVVNKLGHRLQGFASDANGNILSGSITDLRIDSSDMPAQATSQLTGLINLDSRSDIPTVATFDSSDPNSYNTTMAFNVYDSLGNPHTLGLYFAKDQTVANQWSIHYQLNGVDVGTADPLNFNSDGQISTGSGTYTQTISAATLGNGADALNLNLDMTGMTQLGISSSVNGAIQNGFPPGKLSGIQVSEQGQVQAIYSNGQTLSRGQIILAGFTNEQGLQSVGDSLWRAGYESGDPAYGLAGTGTLGSLEAGALELSNVDLSIELVRLIEAQRNYQANAKTIETSNSLTQTLMNII